MTVKGFQPTVIPFQLTFYPTPTMQKKKQLSFALYCIKVEVKHSACRVEWYWTVQGQNKHPVIGYGWILMARPL